MQEDIEEVLEHSLAASHLYQVPSNNLFYNLYYDATWSLANALHLTVNDEWFGSYSWAESGDSGSAAQCVTQWSDYKSDTLFPEAMKGYLLMTNFTGKSVSAEQH